MRTLYESNLTDKNHTHNIKVIQVCVNKRVNKAIEEVFLNFKLTYEVYNAVERFTCEIYSNDKFEHFVSLMDLGFVPNTKLYVYDEITTHQRYQSILEKATKFIESFYN